MEPVKKNTLKAWATQHGWLQLGENGQQHSFLTPQGKLLIFQFTTDGNFENLLTPPTPMMLMQMPGGIMTPKGFDPTKLRV